MLLFLKLFNDCNDNSRNNFVRVVVRREILRCDCLNCLKRNISSSIKVKVRFFDFEISIKIKKIVTTDDFDDSINLTDDSNIEIIAEIKIVSRNSFFNALLLIDTEISNLEKNNLIEFHRRIVFVCSLSRILNKLEMRFTSDSDSDINYFFEKKL